MGEIVVVAENAGVSSKILELQARYVGNLPERRTAIVSAWTKLHTAITEVDIADLHTQYHKLAGSAGMYGFMALSKCASIAEQSFDQYLQKKQVLSAAKLSEHQDEFDTVLGEIDSVINLSKSEKE